MTNQGWNRTGGMNYRLLKKLTSSGLLVVLFGLLIYGVIAITRSGLPDPPTIFSGAAITIAPVGGS